MDLAFVPIPVLFIITVLSAVSANTVRANYVKKAKPSFVLFYDIGIDRRKR